MTPKEDEVNVKGWEDFISLTMGYEPGHPRIVGHFFRGQADASWQLIPSFVRKVVEAGLSAKRALEIELGAMIEFQKAAGLYLPSHLHSPGNDLITWLTFMQHHGVPTRLLDWTTSPFVAAYFAVEQEQDKPGAVWIFNYRLIVPQLQSRYPRFMPGSEKQDHGCNWDDPRVVSDLFRQSDAPATLVTGTPSRQTERMIAQQTVTMVSPQIIARHDDIINGAIPADQRTAACKKLIIPSDHKMDYIRQLRRMNITGATLFPGIDGFGRSVRELITLDCLRDSDQ